MEAITAFLDTTVSGRVILQGCNHLANWSSGWAGVSELPNGSLQVLGRVRNWATKC